MDEASYSVASLAERWQCTSATIWRLIARDELKSFNVGSLARISAEEIRLWESRNSGLLQAQENLAFPSLRKLSR
jgi:hypothetical protein